MQGIINFLTSIVTLNGSFEWSYVWRYLFFGAVLHGVVITILVSVLSQLSGTILGFILYLLRRANVAVLRWIGEAYIWFFRGTPVYVQLLIFYDILPYLNLTRTLQKVTIFQAIGFPQVFFESFLAAFIALSLNEGAYMAEIVRAGIDNIDTGQMEAAKSLGMTYGLAMRRIILPQAARIILPPLGNEFNNMLKTSSLASAIALLELLQTATNIASSNFRVLELLVVASFWYLMMTTAWSFVQLWIERRFNADRQQARSSSTMRERLLGAFGRQGSGAVVGKGR